MKNITQLLFLSLVIVLAACNKDEINNTDTQVGRSRVTNFAVFDFSGAKYVVIRQGGQYAEPGVKAFEGGTEIPVTTTGSVNTAQVGLYTLTYSAVNADGFAATTTRTVVVIPGPEVPGTNMAGKYNYAGTGTFVSTVAKVGEGVYTTDNSWSAATTIPIVFISLDGLTLTIPRQPTGFGEAFGTGTYNPATKRLTYTISIPAQGIANSNRPWNKQ